MKAPWYPFYPKDCDSDELVRMMNDAEFGFFVRCLNHSWLNDGLPADLGELARALSRSKVQVTKMWDRVGPCFIPYEDGRLRNPKQETLRKEQDDFSHARKRAANARWHKGESPSMSNANGYAYASPRPMHMQCSASATALPPASTTANAPPQEAHESVKLWLGEYMHGEWGEPDQRIVQRVVKALGTHPLTDLQDFLVDQHNRGRKPGKSWAWFVTLVEARFGVSSGR